MVTVPKVSPRSRSALSWSNPGTTTTPASRSAGRVEAVPAHLLPHRNPTELLTLARRGLVEAAGTDPDGLRYATAHLAALRAAAAVLPVEADVIRGSTGFGPLSG